MQPSWPPQSRGNGYHQGYPYYNPGQPAYGHGAPGHPPWPPMQGGVPYGMGEGAFSAAPGPPLPRPNKFYQSSGTSSKQYPPFDPATVNGQTRLPRSKHSASASVPSAPPLKSAMKKGRDSANSANSSRNASLNSEYRRPRTTSMPTFIPEHLLLSLRGNSELHLHGANLAVLSDIKDNILPLWSPGTVYSSSLTKPSHDWYVKFAGNPWSCEGSESIMAQRLIKHVFEVLARQGHSYLSSVHVGSSNPRLVFVDTDRNRAVRYFAASVTHRGRAVTLIDPPPSLGEELGEALRIALPEKVVVSPSAEKGLYSIILKKDLVDVNKVLFTSHILQQIKYMGFMLEATVPLAKSGLLGMGDRKEMWLFRERLRAP